MSDGFKRLQMSRERLVGLEACWADRGWLSVGCRGPRGEAQGGGGVEKDDGPSNKDKTQLDR